MGATKQNLDFTNVREGGKFRKTRFPEGDYRAKITKVEDAVSSKDKSPMWLYTLEVKHGGQVGTYPFYCKMDEANLWKLRQLFAACGIIIPKKRVSLDPNKIVGRSIGVTLQDEEYNDKINSGVAFAIPLSEVTSNDETEDEEETEEEEVEPEPAPKPKKAAAKKPEPEPEPEDEDEEEEEADDEEEAEPEPPKRSAKKAAAKKRVVKDDDLEELELDDL